MEHGTIFKMLGTWARKGNLKTLEVYPAQGLLNSLEIVEMKAGETDDGPRMVFQEYIVYSDSAEGKELFGLRR